MAQGRIAVVTHSRSQGHSAVAALAYRAGAALDDERTGERHDYTWRADADIVAWSGLIGDGAEAFGGDLAAFANMVERRETRENARIGRDLQISLPDELSMGDQIRLARTFAHTVSHRYSTPCHLAVHHPGSGDNRNRHAHLFLPTRTWAGGEFGRKLRVLDDRVSGPREITALREMYEGSTNRALERAGLDERIDISWQPDAQPRLGAKATAAERAAAAAQGIDAHGMAMSELVCRVTAPVTPQGQALREHQTRAIELEREIERDQAESRAQLGPLYDAQPLEPHVAVAPAAPERRRRRRRRAPAALTPAPTTMAVQPPEAGTPRRRPTAAAVPAIASQETPNAPYAPARRRRRRRRAPAALTPAPTTMAVQPPEAGTPRRRPTAAAVPAIASQETPNAPYAPARRRRRRRRAPAALTPAPTTMAVQPPEADTPRRRPTAAAVPAAPQETPNTTHAPARRRRSGRRRAPAALTPTPTMVVRSPEADTPRRRPTAAAVPAVAPQETPHQSIDAADLQLLSVGSGAL